MKYIDKQYNEKDAKIIDLIHIMVQLGEILNRPNFKDHVIEKYK